MHIGINCFEDVEIRTIITSIGEKGTCDLTQEKDVYIIVKIVMKRLI